MAPSSGHILIPKALTAIRFAISKTAQAVRSRLPQGQSQLAGFSFARALPLPIRGGIRHPVHPQALLRQSRSRHTRSFATSIRAALSETYPSLRLPGSKAPFHTANSVRAPTSATFGSALRPRLTGGAIPRTAGGYVAPGGRRAFSHVSSSQAHVLANVSAGVRAFWLGGQRAQFDGISKRSGEKKFIAVGQQAEITTRTVMESKFAGETRGTTLEFCVTPELNSFKGNGQKAKTAKHSKASSGLANATESLASDFARHLGVMAAVHRDLRLIAQLGDLPITEPRPGWLAVRFLGCDGQSVERLCDELGVARGIVREDDTWAEEQAQDVKMALLFPPAPSLTPSEAEEDAYACFYDGHIAPGPDFILPESLRYDDGTAAFDSDAEFTTEETLSPLESSHESYSSPSSRRFEADQDDFSYTYHSVRLPASRDATAEMNAGREGDNAFLETQRPRGFQGVSSVSQEIENIYQFIAECDGRLGPDDRA